MGKPLIYAFHRKYEYPINMGKVAQPQGRVNENHNVSSLRIH